MDDYFKLINIESLLKKYVIENDKVILIHNFYDECHEYIAIKLFERIKSNNKEIINIFMVPSNFSEKNEKYNEYKDILLNETTKNYYFKYDDIFPIVHKYIFSLKDINEIMKKIMLKMAYSITDDFVINDCHKIIDSVVNTAIEKVESEKRKLIDKIVIPKYGDLEIKIFLDKDESKVHVCEDFKVLTEFGIDNLIQEEFIPCLLNDDYFNGKNIDEKKVFEGLKIYEIEYNYIGRNNIGYFTFCFEPGDKYTNDILQASAMEISVSNGKIIKVRCYEV